ncbi:hypothetical protein BBP40_007349 [Aspergillus hancockii]|nr:hypothetical protein BBP40_007349 [Aspergillus hancockii]
MDHLILPRTPANPRLNVPALSFVGYDDGDYDTYPERQGWKSRPVAQWQNLFQSPTPDFKAFLQRWLYYGFAHIMFGISDISNLIVIVNDESHSGNLFIRTHILKDLIETKLPQRKYTSRMIHAIHLCGDVQFYLSETWKQKRTSTSALARSERLLEFIKNEKPPNPHDAIVTLSISLIWELSPRDTFLDLQLFQDLQTAKEVGTCIIIVPTQEFGCDE